MSKSLGKEEKKKEKTAPSKQVESWIRRTLDTGAPWLQGEFRRLANYTQAEMSTDAFAANTDKNRFAAVPCQDQRRVVLKWPGCPIDYVHANYVATPHGPQRFICTQGQEETNTIVVLCNVVEKLIVLPLAHVSAVTGDGDVEIPKGDCVDGRQKGDRLTAMSLLATVSGSTKPIVVHCSAGIGRTGTLVAIELTMERLAAGQDCSAMDELLKMLVISARGPSKTTCNTSTSIASSLPTSLKSKGAPMDIS